MSVSAQTRAMFDQLFGGICEPYAALAPDAPDFTILAVNQAFEREMHCCRSELEGRGFFEVFSHADERRATCQMELRESLARVAKEGGTDSIGAFRFDIASPGGESGEFVERWWSPRETAVVDDTGEIAYILHRIEDVSEFVMRGERESTDAEETVLIVEPDACRRRYLQRLCGVRWQTRTCAETDGLLEVARRVEPQVLLVSVNGEEEARRMLGGVRAGIRTSKMRVIALAPNGSAHLAETLSESGVDDVIVGPASARELLARTQAQLEALRYRQYIEKRSRRQFRELFMNAPAFIALLEGPDYVYTLNNPVHDDLIGHRELIGRTVSEVFGSELAEPIVERLDRVYYEGEVISGEERLIALPDPETGEVAPRYINFAYLPTHNLEGEIAGVAVIGWDVTELVEARKTVERQAERLRQESQLKDEFLAMLGHELRNPLAPLATVAQVLQLQIDQLDTSRVSWAAGVIDRQVAQLTGLVDDLLDVARISEGRIELERGEHGLHAIVEAAVETIEPLVERSKQTLEICLPDDDVLLDVDRTRLIQVISNLLHNATKYTPRAGQVRFEVAIDGKDALFVVEDTGQGIESEMLPHVFDLFRQSDKSLARTHGGLGLGLTLVRRLVEMHGGSVCALSDGPGKGSRFEVRLPVVCSAHVDETASNNA